MALTVAHNTSFTTAAHLYYLHIEKRRDDSQDHRHQAERAVVMAFLSIMLHLAKDLIPSSCSLILGCDVASVWAIQRSFFVATLSGIHGGQLWEMPLLFCEILEKGSQTELELLRGAFSFLRKLQTIAGVAELISFPNITELVFDNASENTGIHNGLGFLFLRAREQEWKETAKEGSLPPCALKGCDDHIANLISAEFGRRVAQFLKEKKRFSLIVTGKKQMKDCASACATKYAKTLFRGNESRIFSEFTRRLCGIHPPGMKKLTLYESFILTDYFFSTSSGRCTLCPN
jgi:hypothetical protein